MSTPGEPGFVIPNPRIPSAVGTVNIVLGILLILLGLATIAWTIASPSIYRMLMSQVQTAVEQEKAERQARLADLKKREKAETSADRKSELRNEISELEADIDLDVSDLWNVDEMKDPRVRIHYWVDAILGLALNAAMVVSGAGLISLRDWGRRLALSVAGVKVAWVLAGTAYSLMVIIPLTAERARVQYAKMEAKMPRFVAGRGASGSSATQMAGSAAAMGAAAVVGSSLVALIYPALTIWLLNKRSAVAACLGGRGTKSARDTSARDTDTANKVDRGAISPADRPPGD
jgi:hypothetical protein